MNKKILFGSIFAVALLTSVSFSSVVGYNIAKTSNVYVDESDLEIEYAKDYLYDTIRDISYNPKVRQFLKDNMLNLFSIDFKQYIEYRQLLKQKSIDSFTSIDSLFNQDFEIMDALSYQTTLELIESVEITNPDNLEELYEIIMNEEELSHRIKTLNEMNSKHTLRLFDYDFPIICGILFIWSVTFFILSIPLLTLAYITENWYIGPLVFLFAMPFVANFLIAFGLAYFFFNCAWSFIY